MQSRTLSAVIVIALVAAAVGLFFVLRDTGDDSELAETAQPPAAEQQRDGDRGEQEPERERRPRIPTIAVRGGEPAGGVEELEFERGDRIRFRVRSDAPDEIHVHGYDLYEDVGPGSPASFDFRAEIEGGFEVELHEALAEIARITVEPR